MLGNLILSKRKEKGWSKRELVRRVVGDDVSTKDFRTLEVLIYNWETCNICPSVENLCRLAGPLEIEMSEVIDAVKEAANGE